MGAVVARAPAGRPVKREVVQKGVPDPAVWWLVLERIESPGAAHDKVFLLVEHMHTGKRKVIGVI
jgi:hypothetical protein